MVIMMIVIIIIIIKQCLVLSIQLTMENVVL